METCDLEILLVFIPHYLKYSYSSKILLIIRNAFRHQNFFQLLEEIFMTNSLLILMGNKGNSRGNQRFP